MGSWAESAATNGDGGGAMSGAGTPERRLRRAVTEEDKGRRRHEIIEAAKSTFSAKGFHATTVADVARAAHLSYGSVYWYFDSKDALFHALMETEARALRSSIQEALAAPPAGAGAGAPLREAVQATFRFFERDRASAKLLFRDAYALGDHFEEHLFGIYEGFVGDVEEVVVEAMDAGMIIDLPPRMVAFSVAALIGQIAQRRIVTDDGLEAGVVADFVVSLLLYGLLPRSFGQSRGGPGDPGRTGAGGEPGESGGPLI